MSDNTTSQQRPNEDLIEEEEEVQRNARGEVVPPMPLRDMVHLMRSVEQRHAEEPSPYWAHFTAANCCMAGTHDEEEAEDILAQLEQLGYVEQVPEHDPGSFRTTAAGRAWLDEQLALVGIPAYDSPEYQDAGAARPATEPRGTNA